MVVSIILLIRGIRARRPQMLVMMIMVLVMVSIRLYSSDEGPDS
jgi:hypothetical protein